MSKECLLCLIIIYIGLASPLSSREQTKPAAWDQFEIRTKTRSWLYTFEFYKGDPVDSIRIINLRDTSRKAYSRLFPISSFYLRPEEIAGQISAELRTLDKALPKDSAIWNEWNRSKLVAALYILKRTPHTDPAPVAPVVTASPAASTPLVVPAAQTAPARGPNGNKTPPDDATSALSKKIDTLDAKLDTTIIRLDTLEQRKLAQALAGKKQQDSTNDDVDSASNFYITFLNAANFDFSGKLSTSYLGHFGIWSPKAFGKNFGFLTGIEKINYANGILGNDTAQTEYFYQNVVRPSDYVYSVNAPPYIRDGSVYHHQFNQFTFKSSNTAWSYYMEPVWKIKNLKRIPSDHNVGIYLHLHGELFMNIWSRTQSSVTLADTQLVYTRGGPNDVFANPIVKVPYAAQVVGNKTIFSGYFGAGPIFYLNPFRLKNDSSSRFFFQTTIGFAVNAPNFPALTNQSYPLYPNGTYILGTTYAHLKAFYLVKAHFIHNLSSNSQIVIGFMVRDLLPSENPMYAAFIGLNVNLGAIAKLIVN